MPDILQKFAGLKATSDQIVAAMGINPLGMRIERFVSPTEAVIDGHTCILMGSNNYLGLTFDEGAIAAAQTATAERGTGTTGSRVANGSYGPHQDLERQVADFFGRHSAILFTTGYQANVGTISALAGKDDYILIDAESHASIYDGCRLSYATTLHFKHNDPADLAKRLARLPADASKLVITEGIFSMRGDRAPARDIAAAAKQHGAYLMVDEAHSLGLLGANGRGLAEEAGIEDQVDFIVGTFSKSVGTIGGFCVSSLPDFDLVRYAARSYLFTASLPPSVVASAAEALARIAGTPSLRETLWRNATIIYNGLAAQGYAVGTEKTPIIGIFMADLADGMRTWRALMDQGVYVNLVLPPAAPAGACLLRCSVSAAHTEAQLTQVLNCFANAKRQAQAA